MYLTEPSKETVIKLINDYSRYCVDLNLELEFFKFFNKNNRINLNKNGIAEFSSSALNQFFLRLKIPKLFCDRCPVLLADKIVNHFISINKNKYLFRLIKNQKNHEIRAFLSTKYTIIDDKDLFPVLFTSLESLGKFSINVFEYDDNYTYMAIKFDDLNVNYNNIEYSPGILVSNSETGHSSIWIEPIVFNNDFYFGNRSALKSKYTNFKVIHRGNFSEKKVLLLIEQAKDIAQVGITQLIEAYNKSIDIKDVLIFVNNGINIPNRFVQILEEEWKHKEQIAFSQVAKKIITAVRKLPLFQRKQIEQDVGSFIGLFENHKSRFINIMKEIDND